MKLDIRAILGQVREFEEYAAIYFEMGKFEESRRFLTKAEYMLAILGGEVARKIPRKPLTASDFIAVSTGSFKS